MPLPPSSARFTFSIKVVVAIALIVIADALLFRWLDAPVPATMAILWCAAITIALPAVRRGRTSRVALACALLFALLLVEDPSLLGWVLFWVASASAVLLTRRRFDDAARWALRLAIHAITGLVTPLRDIRRVSRIGRGRTWSGLRALMAVLALPLLGGAAFLALFAGANPIIGAAFDRIALPAIPSLAGHMVVWITVLLATWASLRPHAAVAYVGAARSDRVSILPDVPVATLLLSLATFNAIFALQNGLDLVFLWSGAALPAGVTLAEYAHRGAYTLIAAAVLAGLFVLVALRPDGAGARTPALRRWLVLWIGQTLLLVASCVLRLMDYIDAYSMTVLRLAAMAWMALVAVGLVLIVWRLLTERSAAWLINANALAAMLVLSAASVVDLGATAAAWNVRHARTARDLDLCYLGSLGPSALLSLIVLERRVRGAALQDRVAFVRQEALAALIGQQANPQDWSWRGARRLTAATAALGPSPRIPAPATDGRGCDGMPFPPIPALEVVGSPPAAIASPPPAPSPAPRAPTQLTNGTEQ